MAIHRLIAPPIELPTTIAFSIFFSSMKFKTVSPVPLPVVGKISRLVGEAKANQVNSKNMITFRQFSHNLFPGGAAGRKAVDKDNRWRDRVARLT